MYSLVDRVLLRPMPFPEPNQLVALHSVQEDGAAFPWVSMGNWYDWRENNRTLESTALHSFVRDATISSGDGAFTVPGVTVLGAFFETLRPPVLAGVTPSETVSQEGGDIVVVSESFWRRVLGAETDLDGRTIVIDGRAREVVGVLRSGYEHPEGVELWMPQVYRPQTGGARNNINFLAIGRLSPEASRDQAVADLSTIAAGIRARDPEGIYSWGVDVRPLQETVVGEAGEYLVMLMGAVLVVLIVACANLAALGFARGAQRAGEVATRLSIGASRRRIVRQLLTEDLLLACLGGILGIGLAWLGTGALMGQIRDVIPRVESVGFDGRILVAGLLISLMAGTAAGLPPAMRAAKRGGTRLLTAMRPRRQSRALPGALLVGGEVALTVLLLTGSGLLLMSLRAVMSRDLGFDPTSVLTVDVALVSPEYSEDIDRVLAYWESVRQELAAAPRAQRVGLSNWIPTGGGGASFIELPDRDDRAAGAGWRIVSEDYFETLRIPLLQGRDVSADDRLGSEPVVVINQAMADEFWPSADPIGQRVRAPSMESYWFDGDTPWRTVVGVVGNIRHAGFESEPRSEMYVPYRQMPWMAVAMAAVTRLPDGQANARIPSTQNRVQALDRSLAVEVSSLEGRLGRRLGERRLIAGLLAAFAAAALGLASLGVYSVLSFAVQRRTREVAIRSALGAQRGRLVRLVIGGAFKVVILGTAVGIALAMGARGVLDSLLVDVSSLNPLAYLAAGGCLLIVALAAAFIPARRASRLNPLDALRQT